MSTMKGNTFFLIWVGAGVVTLFAGIIAAFTILWTISDLAESSLGELSAAVLVGSLFGLFIGAGFGLGQAFVVRETSLSPVPWFINTTIGGAIGMSTGMGLTVISGLLNNTSDIETALIMGFSAGLPIALIQWRMLRQKFEIAYIWIPVCIAALVSGFLFGLPLGGGESFLLAIIVISLLPPIISGAGMWLLIRGQESVVPA